MADPRQNFVLVTGAEGFLGRIFTALLEGSGERVIALDSLTSPSSAGASQTVRAACDIRNKAELENIFGKIVLTESCISPRFCRPPRRRIRPAPRKSTSRAASTCLPWGCATDSAAWC